MKHSDEIYIYDYTVCIPQEEVLIYVSSIQSVGLFFHMMQSKHFNSSQTFFENMFFVLLYRRLNYKNYKMRKKYTKQE